MNKHHIPLTDEEKALVQAITFFPDLMKEDTRKVYLQNKQPILALVESISRRKAVPSARLQYWDDPAYFPDGRIKSSHKGIFERNGCTGQEIYEHPHFLPHLYYFLFGAKLPDAVISAFEKQVGPPDWITSGDILPIYKKARALVRQFRLSDYSVPDEFYKLSLDVGLERYYALSIRREVMTAQRGIK